MVGAIVSTETVVDVDAELPARSRTVPVTRSAPSADTTTGSGQSAMPDRSSAHVNVTVTGALYQPPLSGGRSMAAVMVGAVVSMDTVAVVLAV